MCFGGFRHTSWESDYAKANASLLTMQILLQKIWANNNWAEQLRALVAASAHLPMAEMGVDV